MNALKRVYRVSAPMQGLLGKATLTRPAAVKELWAYVKKHNLQDPSNGRIIHPNAEMRDVFQVSDSIKFTQVPGLVSKHLKPVSNE
ncbi:TPA: hypothetical protein N0F65_002628 [Lagenidium giganteum]|uniref:DM2 domain-containing protein n=1 Tax=Lagenidium giganteum TaxID=4803 RepID=A0AAV2Z0Y7_9STRA|nr:TPA: hypothetical protein N0F65_002628 [Lagenidium giganteum]